MYVFTWKKGVAVGGQWFISTHDGQAFQKPF